MTNSQPLRETYRDYLDGKLTFSELKHASEDAIAAREGRRASQPPSERTSSPKLP